MKKPTAPQTWIGLAFAVMTAATSYLGYDKYGPAAPAPAEITTNVAITALPPGATRSAQEVKALAKEVAQALMDEHVNNSRRH